MIKINLKYLFSAIFILFMTMISGFGQLFAETGSQVSSEPESVLVIPLGSSTSELKVRGKIHGQFAYSRGENDHTGVDALSYSSFEMRRVRLGEHLNSGKPIGLYVNGSVDAFSYYLGLYNGQSDSTSRMESALDSYLYNASVGLNVGRLIGSDVKIKLRSDYLHKGSDNGYYNFVHAIAVSGHFGISNLDLRTEYMTGIQRDEKIINGFYIMPSYYIVPGTLQTVVRYEKVSGDSGISLGHNRYADRVTDLYGDGNAYNAFYTGVNYYIYEDDLKIMFGVELANNSNSTTESRGKVITVLSGFRMQF